MQYYGSADGLSLAYLDEGAGLPVICLAGLTRNSADFNFLAPHLPHVRLIRPDYRGRGESDWGDPASYTVPQEAADVLALMDHLGLDKAAFIGTSRGGMVAMFLAATARERVIGVCLNDVGPVLERKALEDILSYLGKNPPQNDWEELAWARSRFMQGAGFENVPIERWQDEVLGLFRETDDGRIEISYDPALRDGVAAALSGEGPDLWPLFDAMAGLPVALVRGANTDLLSAETTAEMRARRPDMIFADVPGRAHVPFLDESESLGAIRAWLELMQ